MALHKFLVLCRVFYGLDMLIKSLFPGNKATLNFYLDNFTDVSSLEAAIRNIKHLDGNTNTTGGLWLVRTEIFNRAHGDRPHVENVAVLITDGNPTWEVETLYDEVRNVKNDGIDIVAVGVTNAVGPVLSNNCTQFIHCCMEIKPQKNIKKICKHVVMHTLLTSLYSRI